MLIHANQPRFRWGPDPKLLPGPSFSVRWSGVLVSSTHAAGGGAGFNLAISNCHSGARLWLNDKLVVDRWSNATGHNRVPWNFTAGAPLAFRLEFRKTPSDHPSNACPGNCGEPGGSLELLWDQLGASPVAAAEAAVANADHVVLVVGGDDQISNEGIDRASLALPGAQLELVQRVHAASRARGCKLVLVAVHSKPLSEPWIALHVDAVLESFVAGQAQGTATAEVLLGELNPAGRLPISVPHSADTLPAYYAWPSGARGSNYCDSSVKPLWAFGHGESFTTFAYGQLSIDDGAHGSGVCMSCNVTISLQVHNTGHMDGDEVVQLYVRDVLASVTTPIQALKGFQRVHIFAGNMTNVTFELDVAEELSLIGRDYKRIVEPGLFQVFVGPSRYVVTHVSLH